MFERFATLIESRCFLSRLLRRGIATEYGLRARNEGKKVEMELNSAKNVLRPRPNDTTEEQVKRLQEDV